MKKLKKAIRFFEKYGIEGADQMLFDLFLEWKKDVEPNVKLERAVYLAICDVREYLEDVATIVQSGKGAAVGFLLLSDCDLCLIAAIATIMKRNKTLREFVGDLKGLQIGYCR